MAHDGGPGAALCESLAGEVRALTGEWLYGLWWTLGCLVGVCVPLLAVIVALTWTRRELVAMVRGWVDRL